MKKNVLKKVLFSGICLLGISAVLASPVQAEINLSSPVISDDRMLPKTTMVNVASYDELVAEINSAESGVEKIINITESFSYATKLTVNGGKVITLQSDANVTLTMTGTARHFTVTASGTTLTIGTGITLDGVDNTATGGGVEITINGTFILDGGVITNCRATNGGGVYRSGGTFMMKDGKISNNIATTNGGGVHLGNDTTFTMEGGEISNNTANLGSGVYQNSGTFTLNNGKISNNTGFSSSPHGGGVVVYGTFIMKNGNITNNTAFNGGGVFVMGTFTMEGGTISDNTASQGGGVSVTGTNTTFMMKGGTISDNIATSYGGGVYQDGSSRVIMNEGTISHNIANFGGGMYLSQGIFTLEGGNITNNTSNYNGGGVSVAPLGTFRMKNGMIFDNKASGYGSGVLVSGTFTMEGGTISDNTTSAEGGGVYISRDGIFTVHDGTISNNGASNGGGVYGDASSTVTMNGGTIFHNTAFSSGGGVYMSGMNTTFMMKGGTISDNSASSSGGGVNVASSATSSYKSIFTMKKGTISDNTASQGGGVYVGNYGTFTMEDGNIPHNTATDGGGVYLTYNAIFTAENGKMTDNIAVMNGGAIYTPAIAKLTTSATTIFTGNMANTLLYLTKEISIYPNIQWETISGGINALNNYDIYAGGLSYTDNPVPTVTVTKSTEDWTNGNVTLTVTATDLLGIDRLILPNGTIVSGSIASYTVSHNGKYSFFAVNCLERITFVTVEIRNIDTEAPSVIIKPDTEQWTNNDVNVIIEASNDIEEEQEAEEPFDYRFNLVYSYSTTDKYYFTMSGGNGSSNRCNVVFYRPSGSEEGSFGNFYGTMYKQFKIEDMNSYPIGAYYRIEYSFEGRDKTYYLKKVTDTSSGSDWVLTDKLS